MKSRKSGLCKFELHSPVLVLPLYLILSTKKKKKKITRISFRDRFPKSNVNKNHDSSVELQFLANLVYSPGVLQIGSSFLRKGHEPW